MILDCLEASTWLFLGPHLQPATFRSRFHQQGDSEVLKGEYLWPLGPQLPHKHAWCVLQHHWVGSSSFQESLGTAWIWFVVIPGPVHGLSESEVAVPLKMEVNSNIQAMHTQEKEQILTFNKKLVCFIHKMWFLGQLNQVGPPAAAYGGLEQHEHL